MNEIEALKADENKIENMNVMIKAMCDFVEDTFGEGTVEQIFGTNGKLKADFFDLLSLHKIYHRRNKQMRIKHDEKNMP